MCFTPVIWIKFINNNHNDMQCTYIAKMLPIKCGKNKDYLFIYLLYTAQLLHFTVLYVHI